MGLRAGLLRDTITIQKQVSSKDSFGGSSTEWITKITTKAQVVSNTGVRQVQNNEIINTYVLTFTVRSYHNINELDRIIHLGKKYRILSINRDLAKQALIILGELIND